MESPALLSIRFYHLSLALPILHLILSLGMSFNPYLVSSFWCLAIFFILYSFQPLCYKHLKHSATPLNHPDFTPHIELITTSIFASISMLLQAYSGSFFFWHLPPQPSFVNFTLHSITQYVLQPYLVSSFWRLTTFSFCTHFSCFAITISITQHPVYYLTSCLTLNNFAFHIHRYVAPLLLSICFFDFFTSR